jgi:hypothetical protein
MSFYTCLIIKICWRIIAYINTNMIISSATDLWLLQLQFFEVQLCKKMEKLVTIPIPGFLVYRVLFIQLWDGIEKPNHSWKLHTQSIQGYQRRELTTSIWYTKTATTSLHILLSVTFLRSSAKLGLHFHVNFITKHFFIFPFQLHKRIVDVQYYLFNIGINL